MAHRCHRVVPGLCNRGQHSRIRLAIVLDAKPVMIAHIDSLPIAFPQTPLAAAIAPEVGVPSHLVGVHTFADQLGLADHCEKSRSEEHTSELQSQSNLVCRLLLEKKNP